MTYAGNVFMTRDLEYWPLTFWPKNVNAHVKFGDYSRIDFRYRAERKTNRQTNGGEKNYPRAAFGVGNKLLNQID